MGIQNRELSTAITSGYQDARRGELEKGASDWKLLLQIDSEEEIGKMWGDAGRIYFLDTRNYLELKK
ncbi:MULTISPECIES: DUF1963 domain-containing protein [unclassified Paenibacillus]|uniref:DUF1963 domain-containing protein n=1 Tax=unclassified Paenibacillus TaxID=185978 RepID=UPI00363198CE